LNSQLGEAEEFIDGDFAGKLGEILIRCNNVMYIRGAEGAPELAAAAKEAEEGAAGGMADE
jgi:small nuclear ribonucleoprotein F